MVSLFSRLRRSLQQAIRTRLGQRTALVEIRGNEEQLQILACLQNYYGAQLVIAGTRGFVLQTQVPIEVELWMCVAGQRLDPLEGTWREARQQRHLASCPNHVRITKPVSPRPPRPPRVLATRPVIARERIS